ncbi:uncharacterized protein RCC_03382 [Ramularia collo-cygni]|uniref:Arrestin-like N-terminal domain-containing protein n=1 Tax=Ramularia collo-cygni TaxID=112498 RepID=A0A2D3US54_9PEZI|nr:uncharacterized protein RCC_03382 [Ramularia collo-cygni]CZT17548.1 uncharacterized protein RCC_03382 [Ramularia collo-cygni]
MADLRLGSLVAEVVVEGGMRPHYGARDAIDGKVVLDNRLKSNKSTAPTADLFVPMKLEVLLRGKAKVIVKQERDMPVDHGGPLFNLAVGIFNGSFSSKPDDRHEFPFHICFPETAMGGALPPSFSHAFQQFPDTVDLAVRYRLGVKIDIPGIDIRTTVPEHGKQPEIQYDDPRPTAMSLNTVIRTHKQKSVIQTNMLLPEDERPQGFQQRLRAVFGTAPKFGCEISCTELQHIWPGYQPSFTMSIRRSEQSDALSFPEVIVTSFRADLIAYTWCDSSRRLKGPFERNDSRTVQKLDCRTTLPLSLTKATEYSAAISTEAVLRWPTSFRHALIIRRYFVKVRMKMKCAEQTVLFVREFEVKMVPRPKDVEDRSGDAGPSNAARMPPPPYSGSELEPCREREEQITLD